MKRRIFSFLIVLCLVCSLLPTQVFAAEVVASGSCGENGKWKFTDDGTITFYGTGKMYDYDDIYDMPWQDAEIRCYITKVVIEDGITDIARGAFSNCDELTEVSIPDSVQYLHGSVFEGCSKLESIILPEGIPDIPAKTFYGCRVLKSVNVPESVTYIGQMAFSGCIALETLDLPDGITQIHENAFHACPFVTLDLPASLTSIGEEAFSECEYLTEVDVPNGVTTIGAGAFYECSSLQRVTLPDELERVDSNQFYYCVALEEITIPGNIAAIETHAFFHCDSLKKVVFAGNAPLRIESSAFTGVTADAYYIETNASWTEEMMKDYGGQLTWIPYDPNAIERGSCGENAAWKFDNQGTLTITGTGEMTGTGWEAYTDDITKVVIKYGVTNIVEGAFEGCGNLAAVTIPDSVTAIGDRAFKDCSTLPNVNIPASVTDIGSSVFQGCTNLAEILVPASVERIGSRAFCDSGVVELNIPAGVTTIEEETFAGCSKLSKISFRGNAPAFAENCFRDVTAEAYYPGEDETWTEDVMQSYGGEITWVPFDALTVDTPELLSVFSRLQTSCKATWKPVDNADGYQLWRTETLDDEESWKLIKTIRNVATDRYTNQGLTVGVTYYYKVRAYAENEDGTRTYSDFSEVKYMPAAVVFDTLYSNATDKIRICWNEIGGAHGYQIWRKSDDGEFKIVKTLGDKGNTLTNDQGATTAYSNTGLTAGKKYTYKLRAFAIPEDGVKVYGAFSDEVTVPVKPETPVILTISSTQKACAELTWTQISGADAYQIYMAESKDGPYNIVKTINYNATEYVKSSLESGKTYYFQMRVYTRAAGITSFSDYSNVVSVTVI